MRVVALLSRSSIFVPLPNDSYFQLCGQPLSDLRPMRNILGEASSRDHSGPLKTSLPRARLSRTTSATMLPTQPLQARAILPPQAITRMSRTLQPSVSKPSFNSPVKQKRTADQDKLMAKRRKVENRQVFRKPSEVNFSRQRIFHSRPCTSAEGKTIVGLSPSRMRYVYKYQPELKNTTQIYLIVYRWRFPQMQFQL